MTRPGADQQLSDAIRQLPTRGASPGFTRRVLNDLDRGRRRSPRLRFLIVAAAAALLLAIGLQTARVRDASRAERLAAQARSLRAEHETLRRELEQLQRLADEAAPVLYLGATDQFDLVLDLRPYVMDARATGFAPAKLETP